MVLRFTRKRKNNLQYSLPCVIINTSKLNIIIISIFHYRFVFYAMTYVIKTTVLDFQYHKIIPRLSETFKLNYTFLPPSLKLCIELIYAYFWAHEGGWLFLDLTLNWRWWWLIFSDASLGSNVLWRETRFTSHDLKDHKSSLT